MIEKVVTFAGHHPVAFIAFAVVADVGISYLLALAVDPRPIWIWREILGVI